MKLRNLSAAWKQVKLLNAMEAIGPGEILLIIERSENAERAGLQRVLFSVAMFVALTMIVQGG